MYNTICIYITGTYWQFGWNCAYSTTEAVVYTNKHLIKMYSDSEKSCLEIDGVVVGERPSGNHIANYPLSIFRGRTSSMQSGIPQRIYSFYLKNHSTGEVIQNLVPCYRKSDNKPGMYDTVTNAFLTNQGEGEFTAGPSTTLPDGYKELEYVESTGTQYIDTGIAGNITAILDVQGTRTDDSNSNVVIGCHSPVSNWFGRYTTYNRWALATEAGTYFDIPYTNRITVTLNFASDGATAIIDGVEKTRIGQTVVRNSNYWLMACNRINEGDHFYAYCKLYSCRIIKDGAVVRNFVPCIRKSDGKVGLYDLVTDTFFVNQGTGEFIAGPTV